MSYTPIEEIFNPYPSEVYKRRKKKRTAIFRPSNSQIELMLFIKMNGFTKDAYKKFYYDQATAIRAIKQLKEKGFMNQDNTLSSKGLAFLSSIL